jgi:iron complex outermembrane recepter protein
MRRPIQLAFALSTAFAIISALPVKPAGAQSNCAPASRALGAPVAAGDAPASDAIMGRRVSLHGRDISLRDALDRLAAAAHIRLSYSTEALDLSRPVCLEYESVPVSRILDDLIGNAGVRPVIVGTDQVVLTPSRNEQSAAAATPIMKQIGMLDRVVVTGSTIGASQRALPVALDVVSGQQLSERGATSLSGALDGAVPGLWLWEQSPLSLLARYGSIRGASSFGVSYPKVYVDGIEVANSLLVTHLDPESVSRIEVIRGPQGAALYGADAISGVMNIVTRQDAAQPNGSRAQIRTAGGTSASDYSSNSILTQSHALSVNTGNNVRSARLGMTFATIGPFIPGASSEQLTANGSVRSVHSRGVVTGTFRIFAQDARTPVSPLVSVLASRAQNALLDSSDSQSVRQYTIGASGTFAGSDRWTHSAVIGLDGYTLRSAAVLDGAFPSALDSALHAASGNAYRTTLRGSTVGQFGNPARAAATVTFAAEHSFVRDETVTWNPIAVGMHGDDRNSVVDSRSNAGFIGQVSASYGGTLFMSGGLRVERNSGLSGLGELATLPMVGASAIRDFGPGTIKLRAAYGKGIRPAQTSSRAGVLLGLGGSLSPEQQSGIEAGADLFFGKLIALHATRFDQRASGLIQPVSVNAVLEDDAMPHSRRIAYQLQNVGEITNRGWEFQGSLRDGPWTVGATYSQVDSRVSGLAAGYTGDLLPGDRMLEVPARTFGVSTAYVRGRLSTSWRLSRASDWVNYDRLSLLSAFAGDGSARSFVGPELRSYWRNYSGVTRLGGRLGIELNRGMTFTLDGENLLGEQRGEPDNITVLPGRTLSAGLRFRF